MGERGCVRRLDGWVGVGVKPIGACCGVRENQPQPAPGQPLSGRKMGGLLSSCASGCDGAARRPPRARPARPPRGSLLSSPGRDLRSQKRAKGQGPRQAAPSSRSVDERQTDERPPFFVAFAPIACGLRWAWQPREPWQALTASGSHTAVLRCIETAYRGSQPRRHGDLLTMPGADEVSEMGSPVPSDPQAEGRPGSSLCGLSSHPTVLTGSRSRAGTGIGLLKQ